MSRGQSQHRTPMARKTIEKCKEKGKLDHVVIIDVDRGKPSDVVIIDAPESSRKRRQSFGIPRRKKECPSIVVISIDDEEDSSGLHSDATSSKRSCSGSSQSHLSEESDSDDCQIFDRERNFSSKLSKCNGICPGNRPFRNCFGLDVDWLSSSSESEDSDCELMEDSSGNIREQWEKAALRKKTFDDVHNQFGFDDQASPSGPNTDPRCPSHETTQTEQSEDGAVDSSSSNASDENENMSTCTATSSQENKIPVSDMDQTVDQVSHVHDFQDKEKQDPGEHLFCNIQVQCDTHVNDDRASCHHKEEPIHAKFNDESTSSQNEGGTAQRDPSCSIQSQHYPHVNQERAGFPVEDGLSGEPSLCNSRLQDETRVGYGTVYSHCEEQVHQELSLCHASLLGETPGKSLVTGNIGDSPMLDNNVIADREKHKETDEYRRAMEEEWASRQQQLQIQAEEAQRLRRRKKAENLRLLDMERRQKLRLEEVRKSQKKSEETINLKEQLRVEARKALENLELKYRDMASLLRGLGIHVGGGLHPMPRDVNIAYKQALLRFHPDRAPRSDIRQQVEAEETFKLISRLKEKLLPSA